MNQKGIAPLAIVAIIIVVAVVVGGAYVATRGGEGEGEGNGGGEGGGVGEATSLSLKADWTLDDYSDTVWFRAKNIGSPNLKFRIEGTAGDVEYKFTLDAGENEAWGWSSFTGWENFSEEFESYFLIFQQMFSGYTSQLSGWTGGDWTYTETATGASVRIYEIQVNPSLPDSLFQTPI